MDSTTERLILAAGGDFSIDQTEYLTPGTYSLQVPPNATSVSIVTVQGGQGGGTAGGDGGALRYLNNIAVTPNEILTVVVGAGGAGVTYTTSSTTKGAIGAHSSVSRGGTVLISSATGGMGFSGGIGGDGNNPNGGGGGGAAGYAGKGGNGSESGRAATAGTGGGGGGGGRTTGMIDVTSWWVGRPGGDGGGVALKGQGTSGAAATDNTTDPINGSNYGEGGSGAGIAAGCGAGGGGGYATITKSDGSTTYSKGNDGGPGGVRIIWPGNVRQFPSTRTADE